MRNILTFSVMAVLLMGCGMDKKNFSDTKLLDANETVNFNKKGSYDLSQYMFPSKTQTNIYKRVKYKDNKGDGIYNSEPFLINNDQQIDYRVDGNSIQEGSDTEYSLSDLKIEKKELVDDFYDIREYRRHVDVGDYYFTYEYIDAESVLYQIGFVKCQVKEHLDIQLILDNNYSDVLRLGCESESTEGVRGEFSEKKTFETSLYFAKDIGQIGAIGEECLDREYAHHYRNCTRTTKELIQVTQD